MRLFALCASMAAAIKLGDMAAPEEGDRAIKEHDPKEHNEEEPAPGPKELIQEEPENKPDGKAPPKDQKKPDGPGSKPPPKELIQEEPEPENKPDGKAPPKEQKKPDGPGSKPPPKEPASLLQMRLTTKRVSLPADEMMMDPAGHSLTDSAGDIDLTALTDMDNEPDTNTYAGEDLQREFANDEVTHWHNHEKVKIVRPESTNAYTSNDLW